MYNRSTKNKNKFSFFNDTPSIVAGSEMGYSFQHCAFAGAGYCSDKGCLWNGENYQTFNNNKYLYSDYIF